MNSQKVIAIVILGVILSVLAGCVQNAEMKLNLSPQSQTTYRVITETGKDYAFVQPSIDKTKKQHSGSRVEMVFTQKIEAVNAKGDATADITIKELKYQSGSAKEEAFAFDSTTESGKDSPLSALIGRSYKIKISPDGQVEPLDVQAVRSTIKAGSPAGKIADKLFSNSEIKTRHQVLALVDAGKSIKNKGDKWISIASASEGMLIPKSFEKVYTVDGVKTQGSDKIATVSMLALPSSKRAEDMPKEEPQVSFFSKMFDEKSNYTGQMVINLTNGQIISYQEILKAEWFAAESPEEQKTDKGPDNLTMGFMSLYSIEKVD
ncbi:MAG: hypothetical protein PHP01_00375 [Phycisphaerae bacterium]|nr:hypothetical protein [Phycisphaerae bacterium]